MEASTTLLATPNEATGEPQQHASSPRNILDRLEYTIYALALALSICVWFVAIRAPLWLDETISFFLVKGGFAEIMSRQGWPDVPVYSYVLWLWTKVMGTGEITLRVSSVLIMLGAALSAIPRCAGTVRSRCCPYCRSRVLPASHRYLCRD